MDIIGKSVKQDSELKGFTTFNICNIESLLTYSNENAYELQMFYNDTEYIGYIIWDKVNNVICEISLNYPSYIIFMQTKDITNAECYYDSGIYYVIYDGIISYLDEFGNVYNIVNPTETVPFSVLPNVTPQLQQNDNCIVAALANVMYYWSNNGYTALNYMSSFEAIKQAISSLFNNSYANNSVPSVAEGYVKSCCSSWSVVSNVIWQPSISDYTYEIDRGYPCMVGFAAAPGSYSESVGHMTMGCGYIMQNSNTYLLALADGHSSSIVYKLWSSVYNDCIITVNIFK